MVNNLHETFMFCSSNCVVNSRVFTGTLQGERSSAINPQKLNGIMRLFHNLSLQSEEDKLGKNRDLRLNIREKTESNAGDVSLEQWIGPQIQLKAMFHRKRKIPSLRLSKITEKVLMLVVKSQFLRKISLLMIWTS
ncbi:hypothetical protein CFOL_v3_14390 [Cephalotus follicularis]|uniref:Uncharacterized protein n=1 Tax=Cephalotus follicularis TaxID=3775 RepID=A0A1Q3BSL3_CEPFO|nr:hypothetical protein CFOL_v3_14390 [Cephalotus follicularis]